MESYYTEKISWLYDHIIITLEINQNMFQLLSFEAKIYSIWVINLLWPGNISGFPRMNWSVLDLLPQQRKLLGEY